VALLLCAPASWQELDADFDKSVLIIDTGNSGCFRFEVHLALSREQKRRGLMFVRDMPAFAGMLFVYERDEVHSMWMKNTLIPLDILFARADGSVSSISAHTEPQSLRSISAVEPVRYVLELNAGTSERLGIGDGSRLLLL
jgi:uncharacterized membrane protein (UPF0127 family)